MTLGVNNVITLSVNNAMTSSVQKVVTHNTNYADTRYQLPRIDNLPGNPLPTTRTQPTTYPESTVERRTNVNQLLGLVKRV